MVERDHCCCSKEEENGRLSQSLAGDSVLPKDEQIDDQSHSHTFTSEKLKAYRWRIKKHLCVRLFHEIRACIRALSFRYLQEVIGPFHTFLQPNAPFSEWGFVRDTWNGGQYGKLFKLIFEDFLSLFFPVICLLLLVISWFRGTWVTNVGEEYKPNNNKANEAWMLINGMGVNRDLHRYNALQLAHSVKKEVHLLHNPTQGLYLDLLECIMGRTLDLTTGISVKLHKAIKRLAKKYPNAKLILCAHSQGAIIATSIIQIMIMNNETSILSRLEVYTFGCAAIEYYQIRYPEDNGQLVPFYEHFANKRDYVSKIGVLRQGELPNMPGRLYVANVEGHMFGEHYMPNITSGLYQRRHGEMGEPKFYRYIAEKERSMQ